MCAHRIKLIRQPVILPATPNHQNKGPKERQGTIWLKDGEFVRPLEVKVGTSDGANTAVAADNLQEGQEVVTGETSENSQATTKNPFLPQGNRH